MSSESRRSCSIHSQRQCCFADPQFQNYIASYTSGSASESCITVVSPPADDASELAQKRSSTYSVAGKTHGQQTPSRTNTLTKAHRRSSAPPSNRSRRNTISEGPVDGVLSPLRYTEEPTIRRRTLDLVVSEKTPRRDSSFLSRPMEDQLSKSDAAKSRSSLDTRVALTPTIPATTLSRANSTATSNKPKTKTPKAKLPTPTNHVHLSRKTYPIPTPFARKLIPGSGKRLADISDITGTFVIDATLVLPKGLFKTLDETAGVWDEGSDSGQETQESTGRPGLWRNSGDVVFPVRKNPSQSNSIPKATKEVKNETTQKNLKLEVENGGINVDIHLLPNSYPTAQELTKQTTIDLTLLATQTQKINRHPLIARIHAPTPRAPFHLTARTSNVPSPSSSSTSLTAFKKQPQKVRFNLNSNTTASPTPATTPPATITTQNPELDQSYLSLHLPRTFHGPITISVGVGNLDAHISFSKAVKEKSVVLREGRMARGVFVGSVFEDPGIEEGGRCGRCGGTRISGEYNQDGIEGQSGSRPRVSLNDRADNGLDSRPNSGGGGYDFPDAYTASTIGFPRPPTPPKSKVKRKPIKPATDTNTNASNITTITAPTSLPSSSSTDSDQQPNSSSSATPTTTATTAATSSSTLALRPITRPSFLDTDPETYHLQHRQSPPPFSSHPLSSSPLALGSISNTHQMGHTANAGPSTTTSTGTTATTSTTTKVSRVSIERKVYDFTTGGWRADVQPGSDGDGNNTSDPELGLDQQSAGTCRCNHTTNMASGGSSSWSGAAREWLGDRIDVYIGAGKVRIQYDDEEEGDRWRQWRWRRFGI